MRKSIIFMVLALFLGLTVWYAIENKRPDQITKNKAEPATSTITTKGQPPIPTFDFSGVIIKNNPGLKPNTWYLIHEQPGRPALQQELRFTASTVCNGIISCSALKSGAKVQIAGASSSNALLVNVIVVLP